METRSQVIWVIIVSLNAFVWKNVFIDSNKVWHTEILFLNSNLIVDISVEFHIRLFQRSGKFFIRVSEFIQTQTIVISYRISKESARNWLHCYVILIDFNRNISRLAYISFIKSSYSETKVVACTWHQRTSGVSFNNIRIQVSVIERTYHNVEYTTVWVDILNWHLYFIHWIVTVRDCVESEQFVKFDILTTTFYFRNNPRSWRITVSFLIVVHVECDWHDITLIGCIRLIKVCVDIVHVIGSTFYTVTQDVVVFDNISVIVVHKQIFHFVTIFTIEILFLASCRIIPWHNSVDMSHGTQLFIPGNSVVIWHTYLDIVLCRLWISVKITFS